MIPVITQCQIKPGTYLNEIWVTYDTGIVERIGTYYPDEVYYTDTEFLGLTRNEAKKMMEDRDKAYLQS